MAAANMAALTWPEVARQLNNPRERQKLLNFLDSEDVNRIRIRGAFIRRKKKQLRRMSKATSLQEESDNQLKNPKINHKLDSEDINRLRIRGAYERREKRKLLNGQNKRTSLSDDSERQVEKADKRAWRSNPSIPTSDAEQVKDKDYLKVTDNVASQRRKSLERKKSKMAFDENQETDSLLPSLEDGSRSAKGSTDVDTTSSSSRKNRERLPSIDENQRVATNKEHHEEEKVHVNSSDSRNIENRNPLDRHKRNENSSNKISSRGNSSDSNKDGDERTSPTEDSKKSEPKSLTNKDKKAIGIESSTGKDKQPIEKKSLDGKDKEHIKIKSLNGKDKERTETPNAEKKKDNRTEQGKKANQLHEPDTKIRQPLKKQRSLEKQGGFKSSFADKEMDPLVVKLERVVNRNLRALQGMKPEDTDDEEDELDQKTINRFVSGDRQREIDEFLNS